MTFEANYTFSQPDFGPDDVASSPGVTYFPHGGTYAVDFSITDGAELQVGEYALITSISDERLNKNCSCNVSVVGGYDRTLLDLIWLYFISALYNNRVTTKFTYQINMWEWYDDRETYTQRLTCIHKHT